jgi:hypothetical protein
MLISDDIFTGLTLLQQQAVQVHIRLTAFKQNKSQATQGAGKVFRFVATQVP